MGAGEEGALAAAGGGAGPSARLRNVRKKLAEVDALELRRGSAELSAEQLEKLGRRRELEAELQALEEAAAAGRGARAAGPAPAPAASAAPAPAALEPLGAPGGEAAPARPPLNGCRSPAQAPWSPGVGARLLLSPSSRWRDDPISVEDISRAPAGCARVAQEPQFEFIEGVQPFSQAVRASERLNQLVGEVSELSQDAFEEDALEMVTRKAKWRLTLLARPEGAVEQVGQSLEAFRLDGPAPMLIGFVIYRIRPDLQSLSVAKIAIVPEHRKMGHGCRLIDWCVRLAKKQSNISHISLSSLPEAVKFYQRLGFKQFNVNMNQSCRDDEDLVEGQVYMEKAIRGRGGKRR